MTPQEAREVVLQSVENQLTGRQYALIPDFPRLEIDWPVIVAANKHQNVLWLTASAPSRWENSINWGSVTGRESDQMLFANKLPKGEVVCATYTALCTSLPLFNKRSWDLVIADDLGALHNSATLRTRYVFQGLKCERLWINRAAFKLEDPRMYWPVVKRMVPKEVLNDLTLPSKSAWIDRFCILKRCGTPYKSWVELAGTKNKDILEAILDPLLIKINPEDFIMKVSD